MERALEYLTWPGNVRELENTIERAVVLSTTEELGPDLLPDYLRYPRRTDQLITIVPSTGLALKDAVAEYERTLTRRVLEGFRRLDPGRFGCFGIADPGRAAERVPTFAFDVRGLTATETKRRLWAEARIQIADGNHYSAAVVRHLGRPEGICRASFAHYDNAQTVDRLLESLGRLAG